MSVTSIVRNSAAALAISVLAAGCGSNAVTERPGGTAGSQASGSHTVGADSIPSGGGGVSAGVAPAPTNLLAGPLALVVGTHAGAPAPGVGKAAGAILVQSVGVGAPVALVVNDGSPTTVAVPTPAIDTSSELSRQVSTKHAVDALLQAVASVAPDSDGSSPLEAILAAASNLRPSGMERGTVLVIDNLLSDRGVIDTSRPGVLAGDPTAVAAEVAKNYGAVRLWGVNVVLTGVGATVPPQHPLSMAQSTHLAEIYSAALGRLGATVFVDPAPRTNLTRLSTDFTVKATPVPAVPPFTPPVRGRTATFTITEALVTFKSNSNEYADPTAARAALEPLAQWLVGKPGARTVTLTGTTATAGTEQGRKARSLGRANAIRQTLIQLGVAPRQIVKVDGVGTDTPTHVHDLDQNGDLVEALAAKNRTVIATMIEAAS